jgi:TetR/AcrR family transcriptional repressor of nem operon
LNAYDRFVGRPRGFDEDEVVRAAAELFALHSYDGTSVDDLVNHLGVHRGSLYKTFGSKRGLYLRALRRHVDDDVTRLARAVAGAGDQAEAVGLVLAAGPKLGLLFHAMVERAPVDPDAAPRPRARWRCSTPRPGRRASPLSRSASFCAGGAAAPCHYSGRENRHGTGHHRR